MWTVQKKSNKMGEIALNIKKIQFPRIVAGNILETTVFWGITDESFRDVWMEARVQVAVVSFSVCVCILKENTPQWHERLGKNEPHRRIRVPLKVFPVPLTASAVGVLLR